MADLPMRLRDFLVCRRRRKRCERRKKKDQRKKICSFHDRSPQQFPLQLPRRIIRRSSVETLEKKRSSFSVLQKGARRWWTCFVLDSPKNLQRRLPGGSSGSGTFAVNHCPEVFG